MRKTMMMGGGKAKKMMAGGGRTKMASKGGAKGGKMTVAQLRAMAKNMGYSIKKV
jgi:hypothetical protein